MKTITLQILIIFVNLFFIIHNSFCCSLTVLKIIKALPNEYVFIGEVVDTADPIKSDEIEGEAWGLRIKVDEIIHAPKKSTDYFEVYPISLTSMCGGAGWNKNRVTTSYPKGTKVRIIAVDFSNKIIDDINQPPDRKIVAYTDQEGGIWINRIDGEDLTSNTSVYNYERYSEPDCNAGSIKRKAFNSLPLFELRKDLWKLETIEQTEVKLEIIKRLKYYPEKNKIDLDSIAQKYIGNKKLE